MRSSILLLVLSAAVLGGCTSAYKTGQTPDDVYFSPERQHDEYVQVKENDDRNYQGDDYYDDRYLRMKVHNRVMWSDLDDYYFYNPRYSYSYYNSLNWNNPWSPYTYWNYSYNPYCSHQLYYSAPSKVAYNHPRMFNLNTYNNTQLSNNNYTTPKGSGYNNNYNNNNNRPVRIIGTNSNSNNYSNSNSSPGNFLRNIFNSSGNSNNSSSGSSNNTSTKSNSSSSSSGSSGSSSGSSTAPVRRF